MGYKWRRQEPALRITRRGRIAALAAIVTTVAAVGYLTGQWSWAGDHYENTPNLISRTQVVYEDGSWEDGAGNTGCLAGHLCEKGD